ncbi:MAG: hypothetical protein EPN79_16130 [Burkholderiaceae bacterium]|nr:MAG: hypothetical protein EPN79_16130 [Burkholderiaceae bacterium]
MRSWIFLAAMTLLPMTATAQESIGDLYRQIGLLPDGTASPAKHYTLKMTVYSGNDVVGSRTANLIDREPMAIDLSNSDIGARSHIDITVFEPDIDGQVGLRVGVHVDRDVTTHTIHSRGQALPLPTTDVCSYTNSRMMKLGVAADFMTAASLNVGEGKPSIPACKVTIQLDTAN